jgi:hypothetical protein
MKKATLEQAVHVLGLFSQKKLSYRRVQNLIDGGYLADLLQAKQLPDRQAFQGFLALEKTDLNLPAGQLPERQAPRRFPGLEKSDLSTQSLQSPLQHWKTIRLGTNLKNGQEFCHALKAGGFKLSKEVEYLLNQEAFWVASEERGIDLVVMSAADLGLAESARLRHIYTRAQERGLELCPPEVAAQLRQQYPNQPKGERLNIAMEPIQDSDGYWRIFAVEHDDRGRWLGSYEANPEHAWDANLLFVFRANL